MSTKSSFLIILLLLPTTTHPFYINKRVRKSASYLCAGTALGIVSYGATKLSKSIYNLGDKPGPFNCFNLIPGLPYGIYKMLDKNRDKGEGLEVLVITGLFGLVASAGFCLASAASLASGTGAGYCMYKSFTLAFKK